MANGKVSQIGGFLKMLLMGRSAGNELPMAVDTDGHLQLDILTQPTLTVAFSTGTSNPAQINLGDALAVGVSSLASKEDHKHFYKHTGLADVRLLRDSTTQISLNGLSGTSKLIEINGAYLDLSSAIVCLTSDNLLSSTGADSGGAAAASTIYYVYASNASASFAPSDLRLSATAPTNGYLGASGNALNWRHVGWLATNASTQLADAMAVASAMNPIVETAIDPGSGTGTTNVGIGWETILGLAINVLIPVGWQVIAISKLRVQHSVAGTLCASSIYTNDTGNDDSIGVVTCSTANSGDPLYGQLRRVAASLEYVEFEVYTYTVANTATYQGNQSNLIIIRIPLIQ